MTRAEMETRLRQAVEEAKACGPMHRRDLQKFIRKLQREIRDYDRFQTEARNKSGDG